MQPRIVAGSNPASSTKTREGYSFPKGGGDMPEITFLGQKMLIIAYLPPAEHTAPEDTQRVRDVQNEIRIDLLSYYTSGFK